MTTDTAATLARMDAARIGPHITCPVSRHAAMMAEAMMRGEPYVMMTEERKYCGSSIGETVASLWAARAENRRLRGMLRDGCDLMAIEVEALKSGISINGEMRPGPEDQNTVDAINELEEWIDRAGRAALAQKGDRP